MHAGTNSLGKIDFQMTMVNDISSGTVLGQDPENLSIPIIRRPAIPHIVDQHLEEAAFYWMRREAFLWRPNIRHEHIGRMDHLLDAHLEGLRIAGAAVVDKALDNLAQWETVDEAFVCAYVLLHIKDASWRRFEDIVDTHPELAAGIAAALFWTSPNIGMDVARKWTESDIAGLRKASIPFLAKAAVADSEALFDRWLKDSQPEVRARALRAAGETGHQALAEKLTEALQDENPACRFEAAAALALLRMPTVMEAMDPLQAGLDPCALRRAILLFSSVVDDSSFAQWLEKYAGEATKSREIIWALTFRGNVAVLPKLVEWLRVPEYAKLAAYALVHISGLDEEREPSIWVEDAEAAGDDEESEEDDSLEADFEDDGLSLPDVGPFVSAIARFQSGMQLGRYSDGKLLNAAHAQEMLITGWQPQRWQAAFLLNSADNGLVVNFPNPVVKGF